MSFVTYRPATIEALDARFQERRKQVPVPAQRADAEGITAIREAEVRDLLAAAGVRRVVRLGSAMSGSTGTPHDGMYPLHRFVNGVADDDA